MKPRTFFQRLRSYYAMFTAGFGGFLIALAALEQEGMPRVWIGYLFMFATIVLYALIGVISRTSNVLEYYVAGRRVPAMFNGMATAADWISQHPEYFDDLADLPRALANVYDVEAGRTNPFLHLSMHLSITEQIAIDQPSGIKQAHALLSRKLGSAHEAQHQVMECLGEMIWASQRSGLPPDGQAYIEAVRRRATR